MKPLLLVIFYIVSVATTSAGRLQRNVWELAEEPLYNYSKPAESLEINVKEAATTTTELPATTTTMTEEEKEETTAAPLSEKGYEYKTVRQLRYRLRKRRDVSHLPLEYLPPIALPPVPSRDYLPPVEKQAAPHLNREYLPPVVHEAVRLSNEYLPPPTLLKNVEPHEEEEEEEKKEEEEETTTIDVPVPEETTTTTEAEPITTTTNAPVPVTVATLPEVREEKLPKVEVKEAPEEPETAVLEEDGYHYRKPAVIPDLSIVQDISEPEEVVVVPESLEPLTREYLPPHLDEEIVEIGPPDYAGEVLTDDGYQYRVIRHLRH